MCEEGDFHNEEHPVCVGRGIKATPDWVQGEDSTGTQSKTAKAIISP